MVNQWRASWLGILLIAALALLVTPVAAQTTPEATEATLSFPLAEQGAYTVGLQVKFFKDASRDGRDVSVHVWYPAIAPANPTQQQITNKQSGWLKATPDTDSAPYPLILGSPGWATPAPRYEPLALLLASHGYVVAVIQHPEEESPLSFVNRPIDVLFTLDQLTASNASDFGGVIDTDQVGLLGGSYGAYTTLALTGARIDPALANAMTTKSYVSTGNIVDTDPRNFFPDWDWDTLATYRAKLAPPLTGDALWPPFTDPRIHAALMWSPCYAAYFGDSGLAAATVPSLIIAGTSDDTCPYQPDDAYTFAHLGSQNRYLLSVVNGQHIPAFGEPVVAQIYTAFFDVYLKGKQDEAQYLTADYVNSVEVQLKLGLLWGPYTGS